MGQYVSSALGSEQPPVVRASPANARQNSGLLSYFRTPQPEPHTIFRPPNEVLEAFEALCHLLPPELCGDILNLAEYWTLTSSMRRQRIRLSSGTTFMQVERNEGWPPFPCEMEEHQSWARFEPGEFPYLISLPIGAALDENGDVVQGDGGYLRQVVVEMKSRDQGWSDAQGQFYGVWTTRLCLYKLTIQGTYEGTYSWFELCLVRDGHEVPGSRCEIQRNVHGEPADALFDETQRQNSRTVHQSTYCTSSVNAQNGQSRQAGRHCRAVCSSHVPRQYRLAV